MRAGKQGGGEDGSGSSFGLSTIQNQGSLSMWPGLRCTFLWKGDPGQLGAPSPVLQMSPGVKVRSQRAHPLCAQPGVHTTMSWSLASISPWGLSRLSIETKLWAEGCGTAFPWALPPPWLDCSGRGWPAGWCQAVLAE